MSLPHPDIMRARFLVTQCRMLAEAGWALRCATAVEVKRAHDLLKMSAELLSPEIRNAVMTLPPDGEWMPASGPHCKI